MKRNRKWIRLDTNYGGTRWMENISRDARRLWPDLLCYVKAHGTAGRTRSFSVRGLADELRTTEATASEFMAAALGGDGGIEVLEDGDWCIRSWHDYQDPTALNAARQQRFRDKKKDGDTIRLVSGNDK